MRTDVYLEKIIHMQVKLYSVTREGAQMYKILEKKELSNMVDQMKIEAPLVAKNCKPGHFIILRVDDSGERIPLTIVDHDDRSVTIIYQKLGYTTNLLGSLNAGDVISDFVGPLGEECHVRNINNLIAFAGGVGAAPSRVTLYSLTCMCIIFSK